MKFQEIVELMRDGEARAFSCPGISGYFYKAPYPARDSHTRRDGAVAAITFWRDGRPASPTLTLYDFDSEEWTVEEVPDPTRRNSFWTRMATRE